MDEQFSIKLTNGAKINWSIEYYDGVESVVANVSLDQQSFKMVINRDTIKTDVLYCDNAQEAEQTIQILSYAQHVRQRLWNNL